MTSWDTESFGTALSRENAVRMDVSVVGSFSKEIVGEKKKFRVFVVEVSQKGQSRLVQLRFSNYAKLWKEAKEVAPFAPIPNLPAKVPSRLMSAPLIMTRRRKIEEGLRAMASISALHPLLEKFFLMDDVEEDVAEKREEDLDETSNGGNDSSIMEEDRSPRRGGIARQTTTEGVNGTAEESQEKEKAWDYMRHYHPSSDLASSPGHRESSPLRFFIDVEGLERSDEKKLTRRTGDNTPYWNAAQDQGEEESGEHVIDEGAKTRRALLHDVTSARLDGLSPVSRDDRAELGEKADEAPLRSNTVSPTLSLTGLSQTTTMSTMPLSPTGDREAPDSRDRMRHHRESKRLSRRGSGKEGEQWETVRELMQRFKEAQTSRASLEKQLAKVTAESYRERARADAAETKVKGMVKENEMLRRELTRLSTTAHNVDDLLVEREVSKDLKKKLMMLLRSSWDELSSNRERALEAVEASLSLLSVSQKVLELAMRHPVSVVKPADPSRVTRPGVEVTTSSEREKAGCSPAMSCDKNVECQKKGEAAPKAGAETIEEKSGSIEDENAKSDEETTKIRSLRKSDCEQVDSLWWLSTRAGSIDRSLQEAQSPTVDVPEESRQHEIDDALKRVSIEREKRDFFIPPDDLETIEAAVYAIAKSLRLERLSRSSQSNDKLRKEMEIMTLGYNPDTLVAPPKWSSSPAGVEINDEDEDDELNLDRRWLKVERSFLEVIQAFDNMAKVLPSPTVRELAWKLTGVRDGLCNSEVSTSAWQVLPEA